MNFPSDYAVELADDFDAEGINRIFSQQNFSGGIAVSYLRDPDTLSSFRREGDQVFILLLKDKKQGNEIIGLGGCIIRSCLIGGRVKRAGYLTGLKILPEYQKKIFFIPAIYQQMHRLTKEFTDVYYTTILSDNESVRVMLEKKRKVMPEYNYRGLYHSYFCKTTNKPRLRNNLFSAIAITAEQAQTYYRDLNKSGDVGILAPADALQDDLKNAKFYGVFEEQTLLAVGYVLDQRSYKQYVVHHYEGFYRLLSGLPVSLLGYPPFPSPGQTANCASAAIWCDIKWLRNSSNALTALKSLWQEMKSASSEHSFLIIGCHESSPLLPLFKNEKHIDYPSRFYQVIWDGEQVLPKSAVVQAEVAFL